MKDVTEYNTDIDDLAADGWEPMQIVDGSMWFKRPLPPKKPTFTSGTHSPEDSTPKQTTRKSEAERAELPRDHPDHSCRDCGINHYDCKECGMPQGEGHYEGCKGSGVLNTVFKALNKHPLQILQPKVESE